MTLYSLFRFHRRGLRRRVESFWLACERRALERHINHTEKP